MSGEEKKTPGSLHWVGRIKYAGMGRRSYSNGEAYYKCVDCRTLYVSSIGGARCNGHTISVCPWCAPGSEPWKNGRGI
jgi:hypothetical protein